LQIEEPKSFTKSILLSAYFSETLHFVNTNEAFVLLIPGL